MRRLGALAKPSQARPNASSSVHPITTGIEGASPPYDVLNSAEARQLAAGNPHSFLHVNKAEIDLPEDVDVHGDVVYDKSAENFRRMIDEGMTDDEIFDFLVTRYGEFALYRPRTSGKTLVLWLVPFALVLLGGFALFRVLRHRMTLPIEDEAGSGRSAQ